MMIAGSPENSGLFFDANFSGFPANPEVLRRG